MHTKDPAKTCSRLEWWEAHKTEFPRFLLMIKLNLEKVENIEKNNGISVGLEKRKRLATEDDVEDNEVEVCVKNRKLILIQMMMTTNTQVLLADFKL